MDNNAQNLTNATNQPQPAAGPAPRPTMPGPAQMGAAPRPAAPPTPVSAMPNLGGPRPATAPANPAAPSAPTATPATPGADTVDPAAPTTATPGGEAPNAAPAKKGLSKKTLYIIIGCVAAVVVIACIVVAVLMMNQGKKTDNTPAPVAVQNQPVGLTPAADLDKEGLMEAFDEMQTSGYNPGDAFTEPFLSDVHGHTVTLIDSYADVEELEDMTDLYYDEYDIQVNESENGTYATILPVEDGEPVEGQTMYVSFNEEYLEYDSEEGITLASTSTGSSNPTFVDTSEDFLKEALPIIFVAKGNASNTLYDISFESDDDTLTMTVDRVSYDLTERYTSSSSSSSTTINTDNNAVEEEETEEEETVSSSNSSPYIIEALSDTYNVDLETGAIEWIQTGSSQISSYPVTVDEFKTGFVQLMEGVGQGAQAKRLIKTIGTDEEEE